MEAPPCPWESTTLIRCSKTTKRRASFAASGDVHRPSVVRSGDEAHLRGQLIYLAYESQIPEKNDYYTTQMGRQPIFIARNKEGELNAFINACSHRGVMLCRFKSGNKATYTCPFHGWTFNNSGKLLKVKDPAKPATPTASTATAPMT